MNFLEEIETLNKQRVINENMIVGSLDVDALYPSLDIDRCAEVFRQKLCESRLSFPNIEWKDISLYLVYHLSSQEIENEGFREYCPVRRSMRVNTPQFSCRGTNKSEEKRFGPWIFPESQPDQGTLRKMFCLALKCMIKVTMINHDFQFNGTIYRQNTGGSIGLDLTGVLSDVYMCEWDKSLIQRCHEIGLLILLYKRYKDDVNVVLDSQNMTGVQNKNDDREVMQRMKEIADSIDPSIKVTTDCCSNHGDGKTPILDVKVWIGRSSKGVVKVLHTHYMKEVSSRLVMHSDTSHSQRMQYNVIVNEMDRITRNCSPHLDWDISVVPSFSYFVKRMVYSGYSKKIVYETLSKALDKYDIRIERFDAGYSYYDISDPSKKKRKGHEWYKGDNNEYESVMFVEATPESTYKNEVQKLVKKHKLKIRVVERAGVTIQRILQRSDPFQRRICNRNDCFVCQNDIPINCRERGFVYDIKCTLCENRRYRGQTSRSAYERIGEHIDDWSKGLDGSPLAKHQELFHPNETFGIEVKILSRCFGKPSRRMITESVLIDELSTHETMNSKQEWTYTKLNKI